MNIERTALIVGVNSYPSRPLRVCVDDAREVAAALSMPEYAFQTRTLLDKEVSRTKLKKGLEAFFRNRSGIYVFYFSGHGWASDVGTYLVTADTVEGEEGVELEYVKRLMTKLVPDGATVIVVLDCCHSGAATPRDFSSPGVELRSEDIANAIPALPQGRVVLAACRGDEFAYEDSKLGHGVFTSHLLQGLLGDAADCEGAVTVTGLYDYISRMLTTSGMQMPVFRGDIAGRLVLGKGFIPSKQPLLTEERARELDRDAQRHLQDFQSRISTSIGDLVQWRAEGHRMACQALEPILQWFERKVLEEPSLKNRSGFAEQRTAAFQRLSMLCGLEPDTQTIEGVVRSRLGTGTFGTVWKVEPPSPRSPLAYKVYHPQDLTIAEKIQRFRRGYDAMKQLDHAHILKVHRFTECPLGFFMDYIDGPNLRSFTGSDEDPRNLISYLLTVGETLRHAHIRGVVHRDVKPENIIMCWDEGQSHWRPFLTDFDLAWFSTATTFTTEALGTIHYASPEQLATPGSASAHAPTVDVYSFGRLCYFVAGGSDPVPLGVADNVRSLKKRFGTGWVAEAADEFVQLFSDCTEPKPERRPADFGKVCDRLFRVSQILKHASPSSRVAPEQFMEEIVFSMVGLSGESSLEPNSFLTLSTRTKVNIIIRRLHREEVDLTFDFQAQEAPLVEGVHNFEQLRKTLLGRIDGVLGKSSARKRYGSQTPFQVFIDVPDVPLTLIGVAQCRALISRVIDVIEGR